uniref:Uncharacterized protein n=1 Tax=Taeniopygia guttata TaxID=59729 RepID=A0A674GKD9_TAEGU
TFEGETHRHGARPEVLGVHVQLRQLGVGALEVVQVLDGFPEGGEHLLAVGTHLGVADDGRGAGQVPEVREEPLGPGVDDQQPGERQRQRELPERRALPAVPGQGWGCTHLARASAPHSSTLTLPQTLAMSCFSSAVQCTMVAALLGCRRARG